MNNFKQALFEQSGWITRLLLFILGGLSAFAFAPTFWVILLLPAFSLLLVRLDHNKSAKTAFSTGWWFGFGNFTVGLYWISFALLVDGSSFYWLIPFAIFGIPLILAFYTGFVCWLTWRFTSPGIKRWLAFSAIWVAFEVIRAYAFTGFPWNLLGYSFAFSDELLQLASVLGIWGLSLLAILAATSLYPVIRKARPAMRDKMPFLLTMCLIAACWTGGYLRLSNTQTSYVPKVNIRLIQGGVEQSLKWNSLRSQAILQGYINKTVSRGFNNITHVIWPETAIPYAVENNSTLFAALAPAIPKGGALITGVIRSETTAYDIREKLWNSVEVINDQGKTSAYYDKHHLVPFGEYIPLRNLFPFAIQKITAGSIDFSEGPGPQTIQIPGAMPSISPLVCYEAIFPRHSVDKTNRPAVMVNVTNDAWYGLTSGPYQHFHTVRVRAIEQGLPLIRAANTGISGMIDPYGRILALTTLGTSAVVDMKLPSAAQKTIYSELGITPTLLLVAFLLIFCFFPKKL